MEPLISVIVPIYKVEEYIDRCIESIVNQTYKNLEVILIDDGSPDNCPQMCDKWAEKDHRIKVLHKENGGLSDARNAGLSIAKGDFISFIDSDDWITEDFYSLLYISLCEEESDIAECIATKVYDSHIVFQDESYTIKSYDVTQALIALVSENPFKQHVWNKLYKRAVIKDLFPFGKIHEDEFWTYRTFGNAQKVTYVFKEMYYYFQRTNSIMGNTYSLKRFDALEAMSERQDYMNKRFPEIADYSKRAFLGACLYAGQCSIRYFKDDDLYEAKQRLNTYRKKCKLNIRDYKFYNFKYKIWFFLANHCFYFCCKTRNFLKIGL
jgi:glycosyltransferase involved in cell wall biosynthesis